MASECSNYWKYSKLNLFVGDTHKLCIMQPGFTFSKSTVSTYASISGSECGTAYGYTAGGITLSGISVSQDNTNNRGKMTWSNVTFTPSGGNISFCGACIVNTTKNIVLNFLDAAGTVVATDGLPYVINNIIVAEY